MIIAVKKSLIPLKITHQPSDRDRAHRPRKDMGDSPIKTVGAL